MANPTTYFGWVMPNSADLVTDLPADFNVFGQGVDTSMQFLLGGTTGQVLSKTSATNMAFTWIANDQGDITGITAGTGISVTSPTGPVPTVAIDTTVTVDKTTAQTLTNKTLTSPALTTPTISTATTNGDLLYGTGSGALQRLGIGSSAQVLTVASGIPSWATPASGKVLQVVNATYGTETASATSTLVDTGLTATITPSLATSKVLVLVSQNGCGKISNATSLRLALFRGATNILDMERLAGNNGSTSTINNFFGSVSTCYLDSPSTTSATTYKTRMASQNNLAEVYTQYVSIQFSTITLLEIGA